MIHSFVFSDGKLAGHGLEVEALRLVRADKGLMMWVDLDDPTEEEIKAVLENTFQFHTLAIEDCLVPSSLPKVEDYDDYLFIVMHAVDYTKTEKFSTTEVDMFLGKDFLVTFHRKQLKPVSSVMEKVLKPGAGHIARGADRLAYMIFDEVVDNYKPVTDELRQELEEIEEMVLQENTEGNPMPDLMGLRSEVNNLRQIIRPQRDVIMRLAQGESRMIRSVMYPYYRDLRDNLVRIEETAASYADQLLISFDLFLSKSGYQANEGIKVLTALTALTIPGMFVGSWYGMNFEFMPELDSPYGYPVAIAITILLTALIWRWCKKRGWI